MRLRSWLARAALAAAFLSTGCGYTLVGRGSTLPPDIKKVYLSPLRNETPRSQVDQILGQAIADELVTRRRFDVVKSESEADAVLSGSVLSFGLSPVTFDSNGRANSYEIAITLSMKFKRRDADTVIWENDRYLFRDNYDVKTTALGVTDLEVSTIQDVSKKFAQTLVTDLLEGF